MKNCILFLMSMVFVNTSLAQTEEQMQVVGHKRFANTIRFTVEVQRDSALCPLPYRECYVESITYKKYIVVSTATTPFISDEQAVRAFMSDVPVRQKQPSKDFTPVPEVETHSVFPWLQIRTISAEGYYYAYNKKTWQFETRTKIRDETSICYGACFIWLLLVILVSSGIILALKNLFVLGFKNQEWIPIVTSIIFLCSWWSWWTVLYLCIESVLCFALMPIFANEGNNSFKAWLAFLISAAGLCSMFSFVGGDPRFKFVLLPSVLGLFVFIALPQLIRFFKQRFSVVKQ